MNIKQRDVAEIRPYEENAKQHPTKQLKQIAESIREFGFNQPIVVDKAGVIIVGHGRYLAAVEILKMTQVPVIELDLTEEQAKAYRLADNKLNESDWDMKSVIAELKELSLPMLDLTGFSRDLVLENDDNDDVIPDMGGKATKSKLGDVYELGRHRLLCGDSTKPDDVERLMDGKKADMVFTDPPYGVSYQEKAENILGRKDRAVIANDGLGKDALKEIVLPAFKNIANNLKNGGAYYICSPQGGELGLMMMMMMMMMEADIECRHMIVWAKDRAVFSMGRLDYDYQHEPILYGWRGSHKHFGNGEHKTSVWSIPNPRASKLHPTMKPVEVMQNAISNSSKAEDIVLDLFLGSGSTLIAAEKAGRACYGMEIDPKYCDVIVQRFVDYTGMTEIKKNGIIETWERSSNIIADSVDEVNDSGGDQQATD